MGEAEPEVLDLIVSAADASDDLHTRVKLAKADRNRLGAPIDGVVRIETQSGRVAHAFISGEAEEPGRIAVGNMLRRGLHAATHSTVSISQVDVPNASEIALTPWIDTTFFSGLHAHLESYLNENGVVVNPGMTLYAPLPESVAGAWYTVVGVEPDGVGSVGPETRIRLEKDSHLFERIMAPGFDDIGGMDETISLVRELVEIPLLHPHIYHHLGIPAPRGIIFHGPPGTGKTYLARAMASALKARFFYIDGPALVGSYHGETEGNLRRLFGDAANEAPAVILLDEVDALVPRRDQAGTLSDTRMVTQILALMDGLHGVDQIVVVGTTNRIDSIDPAARRPGRFDREVYFPPPNSAERLKILEIHTRNMPLTIEANKHLSLVADRTDGFVGSDILELTRQSGLFALRRVMGPAADPRGVIDAKGIEAELSGMSILPEDLDRAVLSVTPSLLRETPVEVPETSWDDIGGLESVKEALRQYIEVPMRERRDLSQIPRGVVLYGPPGTGKTLLVKALASAANANLVMLEGVKVFSRWLGESEETIHRVFSTARHVAPSIVFIEQLDALAPERQLGEGTRAAERVVAQLQVELDGLSKLENVIVVAETNKLEGVDAAILRAGRLGIHLAVDLPNREERQEILSIVSRQLGLAEKVGSDVIIGLAETTEGFSGADLGQVLREVSLLSNSFDEGLIEELIPPALERRRRSLRVSGKGVRS